MAEWISITESEEKELEWAMEAARTKAKAFPSGRTSW